MTLLLLILGAAAAALGTRAAAVAFVGAGVFAILGDSLSAAATWTAATALGLLGLGGSPRRLALPVLGAAAALGVGSARNTAVVLALWVLASATAAMSRGSGPDAVRWALTLCAADIPFVAAVIWTAARVGFEGWPQQLDATGVTLLVVAVALRAPLLSGSDESTPEPGLLVVRTQTIIAIGVVVGAQGLDRDVLAATAVLGTLGFAVGGLMIRTATRDVVQEMGLLATVSAAAASGWGPAGWEWGALAAGTLTHNLRLRVGDDGPGRLAGTLLGSGGIALPMLPVVAVALEGAVRADDWARILMVVGLVAGLAGRARAGPPDPAVAGRPLAWGPSVTMAVVAGAVISGLWAPSLTVPRAVAGSPIGWPAAWAAAVLVGLGAVGVLASRRWGRPQLRTEIVPARPAGGASLPELRLPRRLEAPRALQLSVGALGALAVGMWVIGVLRGFL